MVVKFFRHSAPAVLAGAFTLACPAGPSPSAGTGADGGAEPGDPRGDDLDARLEEIVTMPREPVTIRDDEITYGAAPGAKVTIVEYVDFECMYCKKLSDTVEHVAARYPDQIRVVMRQYVLPKHRRAVPAGAAAIAAHEQGKAAEYRALLFRNRQRLSEGELEDYARKVGIPDIEEFNRRRASPELVERLERERLEGGRIGVRSPPFAFVNGRPVKGAIPVEEFESIVAQELSLADRLIELGVDEREVYATITRIAQRSAKAAEAARTESDSDTTRQVTRTPSPDEHYAAFLDEAPTRGDDEALVTVLAFTDVSAATHAHATKLLLELVERHPDVRIALRHAPVDDPSRQLNARAAIAAHRLGKFWEWNEALGVSGPVADTAAAIARADSVGLDGGAFAAELESTAVVAQLGRDSTAAFQLGVMQTPAFFTNGRYLGPDATVDALAELVVAERDTAAEFRKKNPPSEDPYLAQIRQYPTSAQETLPPIADRFRRKIRLDDAPAKGNTADAEIRIVACADFHCTACQNGSKTLDELEGAFAGKIAFYFRHYPLEDLHPKAEAAHRAAVAAGRQGKFWEMHDFLFANAHLRDEEDFFGAAEKLELDSARFERDFAARKTAEKVADDHALCREMGARGAPSYFVNGRLVNGAAPFEAFEELLKEELDGGFEARLVQPG